MIKQEIGWKWFVSLLVVALVAGMSMSLMFSTTPSTRVYGSVVFVEKYMDDAMISCGSGFIYEPGKIMTARHMLDGGNTWKITFLDGTQTVTTLAQGDILLDVGILYCDTPEIHLRFDKTIAMGDTIYAIGYPHCFVVPVITQGIVGTEIFIAEDAGFTLWSGPLFLSDLLGQPGNSGCPVFDDDGEVVGMLVGGFYDRYPIIIPSEALVDFLTSLEN